MDYKITETKIQGCFIISKNPFIDFRGDFIKPYDSKFLKSKKLNFNIAEVFYSNSHKNVLRGMHFQTPPHDHTKLVSCLDGQILDVVVDLRVDSPTFQQVATIEMKALDGQSILIPKGCAHGFYTYSDNSLVAYLVESNHSPSHDSGILWDTINFNWPCKNPLISERDAKFQSIDQFKSPFKI